MSKKEKLTDGGVMYTMVGMFKCAEECKKFLFEGKPEGAVKTELLRIFGSVDRFVEGLNRFLTRENVEKWKADWKRDYVVFMSVFEAMAEMTDEQRNATELFAQELLKGNVRIEQETLTNN